MLQPHSQKAQAKCYRAARQCKIIFSGQTDFANSGGSNGDSTLPDSSEKWQAKRVVNVELGGRDGGTYTSSHTKLRGQPRRQTRTAAASSTTIGPDHRRARRDRIAVDAGAVRVQTVPFV